jgi:hypothetical protein
MMQKYTWISDDFAVYPLVSANTNPQPQLPAFQQALLRCTLYYMQYDR